MKTIPLFLNVHRSVVPLRHNYIVVAGAVCRYLKRLYLSVNFSADIRSREVGGVKMSEVQHNSLAGDRNHWKRQTVMRVVVVHLTKYCTNPEARRCFGSWMQEWVILVLECWTSEIVYERLTSEYMVLSQYSLMKLLHNGYPLELTNILWRSCCATHWPARRRWKIPLHIMVTGDYLMK